MGLMEDHARKIKRRRMKMFIIEGILRHTKNVKVIEIVENECEAQKFCESWGWNYDDGQNAYWLSYRNLEPEINDVHFPYER